ncbi:MAG: hypothetical protein ACODAA_05435 [Gemmatimonadota bacterium]
MAEGNYDDPLAALPTVAPPRIKKKKDDELAGVEPVDGTITETGDDYFGNFPGVEPVGTEPISHDPSIVPSPIEQVDTSPLAATAAPPPPGVEAVDQPPIVEQGSGLTRNLPPPTPGVAPVPGGIEGIPEEDLLPDIGPVGLPEESGTPGDLDDYIRHLLENPSRYDDEIVRQGLDQIDMELADRRHEAFADIDERMAQRGLVGSSVEASTGREMLEDLERQRSEYALDLQREMANTRRQDLQAAGQLAVAHRANELRELGMSLDNAYRTAALEFEQRKFFGDEEGDFPGTFAQEQYLAELDAYYKTLQMLAQSGMSEEDLRDWQENNPRPRPTGGVPEGFEQPPSKPDLDDYTWWTKEGVEEYERAIEEWEEQYG